MTRLRSLLAILLLLAAPLVGAAASPLAPFYDRVAVTSATTGTGTLILGPAYSSTYQSLSNAGVPDGAVKRYVIIDSSVGWEGGYGTYDSSAGTLTRHPQEGTNGTSPLNLDGGEVIYLSTAAEDLNELALLPIAKPQGRLTLQSGTPVMTADVTGASTIYYPPYEGNRYPWFDGQGWTTVQFSSQLSVTLDATNTTAGALFDVFAYVNAGTPVACYGPAWTNTTTRSAALMQLNGLWVNSASMPCRKDASTIYTVPADEGTYLGTFYATAAGQTGVACKPAAAAGGANNVVGLWNAYNRVPVSCVDVQSTQNYVNATQTWGPAGGTYTSFRISFVDGLAESPAECVYITSVATTASTRYPWAACDQNSTTATPLSYASGAANSVISSDMFAPALGLNYYQAVQSGTNVAGTTVTWAFTGASEFVVVRTAW